MKKGYTSIYGYQVSRFMEFENIVNGSELYNMTIAENLKKEKTSCRRGYIPHPTRWDVYHVYSYKKGDFDGYVVFSPLVLSNGKLSSQFVAVTYYRKDVQG